MRGPQIKTLKQHSMAYNLYMFEAANAGSQYYSVDEKNKILTLGMMVDKNKQYRLGKLINYNELTETKAINFQIPLKRGEKSQIKRLLRVDDNTFLFYKTVSKTKEALYAIPVDSSYGISGSPLKIEECARDFEETHIVSSSDKKSILIVKMDTHDTGNDMSGMTFDETHIKCSMRDAKLNVVWSVEYYLPVAPRGCAPEDIFIDNDRNLYMICYNGLNNDQRATLFQYYWKSKKWMTTPLGRADAKIQGCTFKMLNAITPVVAGIYSIGKHEGYFIMRGEPADMMFKEVATKPFLGFQMWNGIVPANQYRVSKIVTTDNGNTTVSIEGSNALDGGKFLFSNVYLFQIEPDGKEVWHGVVEKKQAITYLSNAGGHALFTKGNDIIVLYNDDHVNSKQPPGSKNIFEYSGPRTDHVLQRFDVTGKATKQIVTTAGNGLDLGISVQTLIPVEDNVYHVQLWHMRTDMLGFAFGTLTIN